MKRYIMIIKFKNVILSIIIAGIIVLIIGFHFSFGMAGLPYQDPTTEMTIRWMAYNYAGDTCMFWGVITIIIGIAGRIICRFFK
jgi:hypothetical protein